MSKKILTIVGARPQIIKAAAVSRVVRKSFAGKLYEVIVHTGQHYDHGMSQLFFDELQIPAPKVNLNIGSGERSNQLSAMITGLNSVLQDEKPDVVLLYGDTNSTLAGALTASSLSIPVAHVEAGLRSYNKSMPEEINRIMTDHVATLMFVPTQQGILNLRKEGFNTEQTGPFSPDHPGIFHCGDIMYDNALHFGTNPESSKVRSLKTGAPYMLATLHRDHNTDQLSKLNEALDAMMRVSNETGQRVILPLHPRTSNQLTPAIIAKLESNRSMEVIEPVSYLDMIALLRDASIVITDSGGLQKEAFFFQKPCVIMRPQTEWTELVENGNAIVCDTDVDRISAAVQHFIAESDLTWPKFYGDGHAADFICEKLLASI
ncbi:MAG: UDP-N-acetylglucosamine 2-epimerase (non-hydrolyzing) [Flavobacteriales bacterium]|nr:UDP-N-acetylglucosamine 2-epimerase (non-hydrolyzing) [Flavobacteriales bacterium]